jgi:uncharacterized membrane protein
MAALVLILLLWSLRYFLVGAEAYFPRQREIYERETLGILVHIGGMMVAAALGPFQFLRAFRDRYRGLHRAMGKVYLLGALVGGGAGLYMAQYSASGIVSDIGFGLLAIALLLASGLAYLAIRRGVVQEHREWMTRSYALILAAVTLRIYIPFLEAAFGEQDGYAIVAWACWIPNLIVAEWLIHSHLRDTPERSLRVAPT